MTNLCVNCEWYYAYDGNFLCNAFKNPLVDGLEECPEYQIFNKEQNKIRQKELEKKVFISKTSLIEKMRTYEYTGTLEINFCMVKKFTQDICKFVMMIEPEELSYPQQIDVDLNVDWETYVNEEMIEENNTEDISNSEYLEEPEESEDDENE